MSPSLSRESLKESTKECFDSIQDPRIERKTAHKLTDIIARSLLGANGWVGIKTKPMAKLNKRKIEHILFIPFSINFFNPSYGFIRSLFWSNVIQRNIL